MLELASQGITYNQPNDILKDPYVFEFLAIPENKPMLEKDLEKALIDKIENFLLELGRGFMFVGSQQRITLGNTHYYVDIVFYNKILKAYVLIDLKMGSLRPENIGYGKPENLISIFLLLTICELCVNPFLYVCLFREATLFLRLRYV